MTTIFALSSGHGKAGVAVIRISGPATASMLRDMTGRLPAPRVATLATLRAPGARSEKWAPVFGKIERENNTGEAIDRGLVLWFPAPASFTGEDMAELQVHGGRAVIEAVFHALAALPGLRPAEPGEFARRAFENGKLDLTAAEGLADLIDAETEAQRRQALRQSTGAARELYDRWRARLIEALAAIEAELDFSDEGDVPDAVANAARGTVAALRAEIAAHLADGRRGEILRDGVRVVIAGPPNAGKSSLMNALAQRDVAIVSAESGTTRDVIEVRLDLGGYPVILMDTAGIREATGAIEREGIRRTLDRAQNADLVLWLRDATDANAPGPDAIMSAQPMARIIDIANKCDLAPAFVAPPGALRLSARTGDGLDALISRLSDEAMAAAGTTESAAITRARHRRELERAAIALDQFLAGDFASLELRAEDLRHAATALGRITGRIDVEDVLDRIFADFCIGK